MTVVEESSARAEGPSRVVDLGVPAWGWVPDLSPNFGLQSGEVDGGDPTTRAGYLVWPGCTILETPFCRPSKGKNLEILPQKAGNLP